jgi:hypothetical protein
MNPVCSHFNLSPLVGLIQVNSYCSCISLGCIANCIFVRMITVEMNRLEVSRIYKLLSYGVYSKYVSNLLNSQLKSDKNREMSRTFWCLSRKEERCAECYEVY